MENSNPVPTLASRCLALTGAFETSQFPPGCFSGLAGDFDGQGLSFGALQWNIGQGTLQPLLKDALARHPAMMASFFREQLPALEAMLSEDRESQLSWAQSIQDPGRHQVLDPWRSSLLALGAQPEFQAIQLRAASPIFQKALGLCQIYGVASERAVALFFDICVQNGGIPGPVDSQIRTAITRLPWPSGEVDVLRIVANCRAGAVRPAFVEDVRRRKLTIAEGTGTVHGRVYNLAAQFQITLRPHL